MNIIIISRIDFKRIQRIRQSQKDIVYGFIKEVQPPLPSETNSYYIIPQLIQDLCLLFFDFFIKSEILTDDEKDSFLRLLESNNKFIGAEWNLLYRKSTHKNFNDEEFVKKIYENKRNIIFIVESTKNKVLGGYSSVGWKSGGGLGPSGAVYNHDAEAFVFGIRAIDDGPEIFISNVRPEKANVAIRSQRKFYLLFGTCAVIHLGVDGYLHHGDSHCYSGVPRRNGHTSGDIKDLEIFQIKQ